MTVKTRFAPSPTGYLHIGGVRTALFNWLYARGQGGTYVLRIEDTDRERSTEEAIQVILDGLAWLQLDADEGPYFQTRRYDRYREIVARLLEQGDAYHCYCSKEELEEMRAQQLANKEKPRYNGRCRDRKEPKPGVEPVVRFRTPLEGSVEFDDLVRGPISIQNSELDDLVLVRSDGHPTYNFSVVVDDMDMAMTHVIRGEDHINNTPRQINIFKALGAEPPRYGHVPLIMGADGGRLSKRHGAVSVLHYRQEGFLPEALLNYLVRLGWSHGDQEIFSVDEMIRLFDISDVNKSASTFNMDKLIWINQQYIKNAEPGRLVADLRWQLESLGVEVEEGFDLQALVRAQQERSTTLREMAMASLFFFREVETYEEKAAKKNFRAEALAPLQAVRARLADLQDWRPEPIHQAVINTAEEMDLKLGKVAQPIRVAVSGGPVSPPIDQTLAILGRQKTLVRLDRAIESIGQQPAP
jgi:glutamyl-tRNA synthetase